MNKDAAIVNNSGIVVAINVYPENYKLGSNEILVTDTNPAYIGGDYVDGYFYSLQPFPSWTSREYGNWIAPISRPSLTAEQVSEGKYFRWNEETQNWTLAW